MSQWVSCFYGVWNNGIITDASPSCTAISNKQKYDNATTQSKFLFKGTFMNTYYRWTEQHRVASYQLG